MLAQLATFTLLGIDAVPVEVEVDVAPAVNTQLILVGLPEAAVRESLHRVERAIANSGFAPPKNRVVINLAPAELPKQAASFDLPISIGLLIASGQLTSDALRDCVVVGELSLEGTTRGTRGILAMAMQMAKQHDRAESNADRISIADENRSEGANADSSRHRTAPRKFLVPACNADEASVVEALDIIPIHSLSEAAAFLANQVEIEPKRVDLRSSDFSPSLPSIDFDEIKGQELAKRAMTIAAAGAHNLLMLGPPGSGKTMLAKRLPTILPEMSAAESVDTTCVYSAVGQLAAGRALLKHRPFRSPHHTISPSGLVGGGRIPTPGEISLAHNGVLFLDELPEFSRRTLEVMRQPLEDGTVTISRALRTSTLPSQFILVAALNPCPCGYLTDSSRECHCTRQQIDRYMQKISGPLLDRVDLQIEVPAVDVDALTVTARGTSSQEMRECVVQARAKQAARCSDRNTSRATCNAKLNGRDVEAFCKIDARSTKYLKRTIHQCGLSARAYVKILRVARTIADLDSRSEIQLEHVQEAVNYRLLDRKLWCL